MKKLIKGKLYDIKFSWGIAKGYYYTGRSDYLCGQLCDCCNKELMNGHLFMKPFDKAGYEDCINGKFESQLAVGTTCINKVEITEYK